MSAGVAGRTRHLDTVVSFALVRDSLSDIVWVGVVVAFQGIGLLVSTLSKVELGLAYFFSRRGEL